VRTWESIHRFEIIGVLANLKQLMKNLERNRSKEREWLAVKEGRGDELAHAFRLVNLSNDYLVCSLEGKALFMQATTRGRQPISRTSSRCTGRSWTSSRTCGRSRARRSAGNSSACR
jgi:hypothetical protein